MKLFGLAILGVLLAATFAGFVTAEQNGELVVSASPALTAAADIAGDDGTAVSADDSVNEIKSKCIVSSTASGARTLAAGCAVRYCGKPVASVSDFEKCLKLRATTNTRVPPALSSNSGPKKEARTGAFAYCNSPLTNAADVVKCARTAAPSDSAGGKAGVTIAAKAISSAALEQAKCRQVATDSEKRACLKILKGTLEDAKERANDATFSNAGKRLGIIAKAVGVGLADDDAPTKIEAEVKARDDAYSKIDGEYKTRLDELREWRKKTLADLRSDEREKYRTAVGLMVRAHVQRLKAFLSKLEAEGVDTAGARATLDGWIADWTAADTKEEKLAVIAKINGDWPALRKSLQEQLVLSKADDLSARVLSVAATARVTAAGIDSRGGDSSAIIAAAAKLEGIAAKLSAATSADEAKAAREQLEPALKELRQAVRTAVATVTGAVVTPAPEASATATVEADDGAEQATAGPEEAEETPEATVAAVATASA